MQINLIHEKKGQTMILSTVLIGGALLAATAIAGFTLFFQIRQAGDAVQSAAAFYAADAGIEHAMYCYYRRDHTNEDIDVVCDTFATTEMLETDDISCDVGTCKPLASASMKLSCFINPSDKTAEAPCKPPLIGEDPVKGIYILSKGSTVRAERVLDYTIVTNSGQ
ncbi:hypothetical protein C4565_01210 [Candidatus Parcubacteria bacterium]|jgi:hypothetical protein|nr:MAG: hypothetical protein C4565_01210 [Candidatus Parcubacteria bacterium]